MRNAVFLLLMLSIAGTPSARAGADTPLPPADLSVAAVRDLVPKLDHDDFRVRHRAALLLKNMPGDAWPAVREALGAKGLSAEARRSLESVGDVLKARHLNATRYNDLSWNRESAVAAYASVGRHSAKWDEAARAALRLYPRPSFDPQVHPKDDAARVQAFETAAHAGCDDPLFLYCYARLLGERPEEQRDDLKIGQLYATAAKEIAESGYPAVRKCFVLARYGNGNSLPQGEGDAAFKKVLELIPAAAKEAGVRPSHVLALARMAADGLGRVSDRKGAYESAQKVLDAALPGKVEPLLFKGEFLARLAQEGTQDQKIDPLSAPPPLREVSPTGMFGKSIDALRAAYELDPTDGRAAAMLLGMLVHPGSRPAFNADDDAAGDVREQINLWFGRAMRANPDNYDACLMMMEYLQTDWRSGGGGAEAVLRFGHSCAAGGNYYGRIPFILAEAHIIASQSTGNRDAYLRDPEVWKEIRNLYQTHLSLFPDHDYYRSGFAKWAVDCGRWDDAVRLFDEVARREAADFRPFETEDAFELYRQRASDGWTRTRRKHSGP